MSEITDHRSDLTKLTVNMTPNAMTAVNLAAERLGDSRTDTINRAVQIYNVVTAMRPGERVVFDQHDEPLTLVCVGAYQRMRQLAFGALLIVLAFAAGFFASWH